MKRIIIIVLLMFVTTSCVADPRREADAYATRKAAEMQAYAQKQALQQDAEEHALLMEKLREVGAWISTMMMTTMIAVMFTVFVSMASLGIGVSFASIGTGIGMAKRELVKPHQIKLDRVTHQYPILPVYLGNGKYSLTNPNDGSVLMLDTNNPADMLKVRAAFGVQHTGTLAHHARLSHKPGEIAQIDAPQILEAE